MYLDYPSKFLQQFNYGTRKAYAIAYLQGEDLQAMAASQYISVVTIKKGVEHYLYALISHLRTQPILARDCNGPEMELANDRILEWGRNNAENILRWIEILEGEKFYNNLNEEVLPSTVMVIDTQTSMTVRRCPCCHSIFVKRNEIIPTKICEPCKESYNYLLSIANS